MADKRRKEIQIRWHEIDAELADIRDGKVSTVIVWRLDSLALLMREGVQTLSEWCDMSLRIVSVDQQIDLKGNIGAGCCEAQPGT